MTYRARFYLLLLIGLIGPWSYLSAQSDPATALAPEDSVMFGAETPLQVVLYLDMKQIFRKKKDEDYFDGRFVLLNEAGDSLSTPVCIMARGEFRRNYCSVPPLKISFKPATWDLPGWDHLKSLKLVTACRNQGIFEEFLFREYLCYRLYETLTPRSFQVRLARITYIDIQGRYRPLEQFAFFLEDIDDVAARNHAFELEPEQMRESWAVRSSTIQMTLFQYAIGNTDWHIGNLHNFKLIKTDNPVESEVYFVPYDFDYAGMVNTRYATPDPNLGIQNVTQRVYQGRCYRMREIDAALEEFLAHEEQWYQIIATQEYCSQRTRDYCQNYLAEFFETIKNQRSRQVAFFPNCPYELEE